MSVTGKKTLVKRVFQTNVTLVTETKTLKVRSNPFRTFLVVCSVADLHVRTAIFIRISNDHSK